ncbi:MAG: hypothetical protein U1F09_01250 [Steroidobacteraceae bacterium]
MNRASLAAGIALLLPFGAFAAVTQVSADGAIIEHRFQVAAAPAAAWSALVHPELWWPSDHTWSGDRANLRLEAQAGGCFCENWGEASAEHGRVVMAQPAGLLRIRGALGPLQDMAVTAVLTIRLAAAASGGTEAIVTYRISGDPSHKLDALVPVVDKVVGQQFGSFAAYASGTAVKPAP